MLLLFSLMTRMINHGRGRSMIMAICGVVSLAFLGCCLWIWLDMDRVGSGSRERFHFDLKFDVMFEKPKSSIKIEATGKCGEQRRGGSGE